MVGNLSLSRSGVVTLSQAEFKSAKSAESLSLRASSPTAVSDPSAAGALETLSEESLALTGVRCLAMVASHRGLETSFERIVHDHVLQEEPTVPELLRIARSIGMRAKAARLKWSDLGKLGPALPALVRLRNGNFMLLVGVKLAEATPTVILQDPLAGGAGVMVFDEYRFTQAWSGEVIFLKRDYRQSDADRPFNFGWFVPEITRQWRLFRDVAICALLLSVLSLGTPIFTQLVIDRVLIHHSINTLFVLFSGVLIVIAFDVAFSFLRRYLILHASNKLDSRINVHTFSKLLRLPMGFFEHSSTGVLTKNMLQAEKIRSFLTGQLFTTVLDLVGLVVLVPVMFLYSPMLACLVLGFTVLICLFVIVFLPPIRRKMLKLYEAEARQQAYLVESIQGMRTVKSLSLDAKQRQGWDVRVAQAIALRFEVGTLMNGVQALTGSAEKMMMVSTMALGAYLVFTDNLMVGALIAFNMISQRVTHPLVQLAQLIQQYQEASLSVQMLGQIMNQPDEPGRSGKGVRAPVKGHVQFEDVLFRYNPGSDPALDRVSFDIPAGTIFGIMGRSGSGKTTVTRLLQGLHPAQQGLIRLDNYDLREIDLDHLRSNIGVVLQDNFLFKGTIRENIAAGKPNATFEEIAEAARLAGADEFIERLPQGYNTMLEEGSSNLSGGQRQRLAIARALLPNPPILILDEATSALDAESEAIVQANLMSIARGRTLIVISHRLSSLVSSDQILVLERGKAIDVGRHQELLGRCKIYQMLWNQQNRHIGAAS